MRLLPAGREILRVLEMCPWMPADVIMPLVGARSRVSVYQALARLTAGGLVQLRRVRLGPLTGSRATTLWSATPFGRDALSSATCAEAATHLPMGDDGLVGFRRCRSTAAAIDPICVAAARGFAAWLARQSAQGKARKVIAWEAPWIRASPIGARIRFAAGAVVRSSDADADSQWTLVLPDLGTAPVVRYGAALRRLFGWLASLDQPKSASALCLLILTTNVDGGGQRQSAWTQYIERLRGDAGLRSLTATVLDWDQVHRLLGLAEGAAQATEHRPPRRPRRGGPRADELFDLLGRHPFLTIAQLAALLAVSRRRMLQLRQSLVDQGLVRLIPSSEVATHAPRRPVEHHLPVGDLAELTAAGRHRLARQLGLPVAAARRHQGLFGGSPRRRHRALCHLAHTIGANQVFVSLALAARAVCAHGGDEALEEWRPAAACERSRCKPDGYGCYRRGDARFGFFLEYDRGTERASQYDAKLNAYAWYFNSRDVARDYVGLPHVLFVSNSNAAEERMLRAIERAMARHGDRRLHTILTTTTRRIAGSDILGAIWRSPGAHGTAALWR